jgi:hypothetical protein
LNGNLAYRNFRSSSTCECTLRENQGKRIKKSLSCFLLPQHETPLFCLRQNWSPQVVCLRFYYYLPFSNINEVLLTMEKGKGGGGMQSSVWENKLLTNYFIYCHTGYRFKATFDQFDHYRLPNSRAVLELDHALIDALLSGWLSTSFKTKCLLSLLSSHLIRSSESRLSLSYFLSTVGDVIAILFEMSLFSMGCSLM